MTLFIFIKKHLYLILAGLLLIAQLILQLNLAKLDAQTTDEGVHLAAGYTYVTKGDFRFDPEHPPLLKALGGLAILHLHPKTTPQMEVLWNQSSNYFYDSWQQSREYGEMLLYQAGNNPQQLLFWGRFPFVLTTFFLGLTILLIAWREWGELAALAAVAMFTLDPSINANGHLIDTDIGASLGYILVVYTAWKFFNQPKWGRAAWLGGALGLALLLKHTAIIAFPALLVFFIIFWALSKERYKYFKQVIPKILVSFVITWVIIWAGFGFHDRIAPPAVSATGEYYSAVVQNGGSSTISVSASALKLADKTYTIIRPALDILPGDYVKGVFMVLNHADSGQTVFFLGQTSHEGWWYYFPVMLIFKLPVPSLILIAIALYFTLRKRPTNRLAVGTLIGAAVFLVCAMTSKDDLGERYVLPLYPILFIVIGYTVANFTRWRYVYLALFAWLAVIMIISYPYYLGYFNNLVPGGSYGGYKISADSNLDWGQNLKDIASYIKTNHISNPYIEYGWDGNSSLDYYIGKGDYKQLSTWQPGDGGYAFIGASAFDGSPGYKYLHSCPGLKQITPGLFVCQLH